MVIVVDTNIIFTYFFKKSVARKLITEEKIDFISNEFALKENKKYEKK